MGFKQCEFHKPSYDYKSGTESMVLDNVEKKTDYKSGKWATIEVEKKHPKWDKFYKLIFSENITVWMYIERQSTITNIWIEGNRVKNGLELIYNYKNPLQFNSKSDIINLFPKEIKRDFILNSLFS